MYPDWGDAKSPFLMIESEKEIHPFSLFLGSSSLQNSSLSDQKLFV